MPRKVSRAAIVRAARTIARRRGIEAITTRSVAAALDVTPMALYRHVGSSAGLRLATLDFLLADVRPPPPEGTVTARLRVWAHGARAVLIRYPGLADAVLTEWVTLSAGCRIVESLLAVVSDGTDDDEVVVGIANAVFVYVLTRVMAERAVLAGGRRRALPAVTAEPDRFPHLVRVQGRFASIDTDRHFGLGLEALLAGLAGEGARP